MHSRGAKDQEIISYKQNFLSEVIVRVDFLSPIKDLENRLPKDVSAKAKIKFPIAEPRKVLSQELQFSPQGLRNIQTEITEWHFHGKNKDKTLTLTPAAFFIKYTSYKSFEVLKEDFLSLLNTIFQVYPDAQGARFGLRYVNNIGLKENAPLSWESYINNHMLCIFQLPPDNKAISRALTTMDYNYGDFNLRHTFGVPNPDYPAVIKKKSFVIDLDAYYQGVQDYPEIKSNLDKYHSRIQEFFELSITDKLREILNGRRERNTNKRRL